MSEGKNLIIRNSTAEFLIFEKQAHADSIEVRYEDETLWLTQKMMSNLFDVESNTITNRNNGIKIVVVNFSTDLTSALGLNYSKFSSG